MDESSFFQSCNCRFHTCLQVVYFVTPPSLSCDVQWGTAHLFAFRGKLLDGFPHLLNLTDAQLGLIEEYEVLVEVAVCKQHEALGLHLRISSCTARFLDIVLQRVADVVVNHQSYIFLVYAHTKG